MFRPSAQVKWVGEDALEGEKRMKTSVTLKYEGPALDTGRMDVYEASANMIAFSEFMVAAVKATYGDAADAKAEVNGFERGSFATDLVIQVAGTAATLFTALDPEQLWSVVKEAFALWKMLKGSPPKSVAHKDQHVTVTNNSGQIIQVRTESLTLVLNDKASAAAQQFIKTGLDHEGYTAVKLEPEQGAMPAISVERADAESFVPVVALIPLSDNRINMTVIVVAAVFQDGNKWRFSDGANTFSAAILDGDFLASVDRGERFGKGDVLEVQMRVVQSRQGMKVAVERTVEKVLRHIHPHEQIGLA